MYTWFLAAYKVSVAVGMTGYVMLICEIFGLGVLLDLLLPKGTSILLIWYGLYFGVLGRDCAEVAADQMVRGGGWAGAARCSCGWRLAAGGRRPVQALPGGRCLAGCTQEAGSGR